MQLNAERGWLLLSMCLAVCAPSDRLYPYLLCYVSQHGATILVLRVPFNLDCLWSAQFEPLTNARRPGALQEHVPAPSPARVRSPAASLGARAAGVGGRSRTRGHVRRDLFRGETIS